MYVDKPRLVEVVYSPPAFLPDRPEQPNVVPENEAKIAQEALQRAKRAGVPVSYYCTKQYEANRGILGFFIWEVVVGGWIVRWSSQWNGSIWLDHARRNPPERMMLDTAWTGRGHAGPWYNGCVHTELNPAQIRSTPRRSVRARRGDTTLHDRLEAQERMVENA